VTADQRASIDQQLHGMPAVRDVAFKTKQQAYEDFKQQFKDQPDLVAGTRPDSLPESFTATADSGLVEAIETVLASTPGVDNVTVALPSGTKPHGTAGMIVQLRPDVTADERTAIEAAVHALPDAKPARFESADAARTRLKERCRKEPALATPLDRASAFASYRFSFTLTSNSFGSREYLALDRLPGIETEVLVPAAFL
jgi:cell division protein FtsX